MWALRGPCPACLFASGQSQLRAPAELPGACRCCNQRGIPQGHSSHPPAGVPRAGGGRALQVPLGPGPTCVSAVIGWLLHPSMYFPGVLGF